MTHISVHLNSYNSESIATHNHT